MAICDKCESDVSQLWAHNGGPALCATCKEVADRQARAEANKPTEGTLAFWAEEERRLKEARERESQLPNDPHFCTHNDTHTDTPYRAGRPAVGFNERGELCCQECIPPERNPVKLAERLAALEQAVAALQAGKPTVKGKAAG